MSRLRSIIYMAAGAAAITYGAHQYATRYSDGSIWQRQSVHIERIYRNETALYSKIAPEAAASQRQSRFKDLRSGLAGLEAASGEERCRFEAGFERRLYADSDEAVAEALANESFQPYPHCTAGARVKDETVWIPFAAGALALLYGLYRFLQSFRKDPGILGKDGRKRQKEMENERRETLLSYGIGPAHALTITQESIRVQSVDDVLKGHHLAIFVINVLENYGFSKDDVQRILLSYPGVLNRSPEQLCERLSALEDGGTISQDELRARVLRLPGILGS